MKCPHCPQEIPFGKIGDLNRHIYAEHREVAIRIQQKAAASRRASRGKGKTQQSSERAPNFDGAAPPAPAYKTEDPKLAQSLYVAPKAFYMNSQLLWQARDAAIKVWKWPADITMDDFLDTFLYIGFRDRGVILGGYVVLNQQQIEQKQKEDRGNGTGSESSSGRVDAQT